MDEDRDRLLRMVRERLTRARTADGRADADVVFAPEADHEFRSLLRAVDTATDMEARHVAGLLCMARTSALPRERAGAHRAMVGTLLFPVWMRDPRLVPADLAAAYARTDPGTRPDPDRADGPEQWSAEYVATMIAAAGEEHDPPPDAPEHVLRTYELAARTAAMSPSREVLLDTALGLAALAEAATPEDDPAYRDRLADLHHVASLAGLPRQDTTEPTDTTDTTGDQPPGGVDAAVLHAYRTLTRMPAGSPGRIHALNDLGTQVLERYQQTHDPEDLHEAVGLLRDTVAQLPDADPHAAGCLGNLAAALMVLLDREGGTAEEYDEVVDVARRAVLGAQDPAAGLNLGLALMARYGRAGRRGDLDEAVDVLGTALGAPGAPERRTGILGSLGNVLRARFLLTGDRRDLDTAITYFTEVLAASGEVTARFAGRLLAPSMALYARFTLDPLRHAADLAEALRLLRRAEALLPPGHPVRPVALSDLGFVLLSGYERSGSVADLNGSVNAFREAVALTPRGHEILGVRLLNLAMALDVRHRQTDDGEDLRDSLECRRRATTLPGLGAEHRALLLGSAGLGAMAAAARAGHPVARLDEAVARFRDALALTPAGSPLLARRLSNLASALLTRHDRTGRTKDAREARTLADAAVRALAPDSPELPVALALAAGTRSALPSAVWSPAARGEAAALLRRAVAGTPPGHAERAPRLMRLGEALWTRGTAAGRAEAARLFQEAAEERQCAPSVRLTAATNWGRCRAELGEWEGALDGYVVAVDLLHAVAPRHLVRDDQEFLLGRHAGLGAAAAACAVRLRRYGLAVGLLEQARGVLLSHAFDADSDLTRLREAAPDLADRFEELRDALDTATGDGVPPGGFLEESAVAPRVPGAARTDLRQRLAVEWDRLAGRIRAEHPGLGLLRPVREWDEGELCATASAGPVVLVNVSPYGSDALIVTGRAIDAVPLPGLVPREVAARGQALEEALARIEAPGTTRGQSLRAQRTVRGTLDWLWREVTGPVLGRLGLDRPDAGAADASTSTPPRLWWSPGGALRTLPLHAAAPADGSPGALDHVVPSYTPTLRTLHHSRQRLARPGGAGALVVAVPEARGQAPLPGARREAEHLAGLLPGATVLVGASATHSAVVAALPRHAYAHFACHASAHPDRPSDSPLVLHDHAEHPLTVRDLARLRLPSVRLAYLSACDTLRTSPELADESVHIVSAFQMAGFPHVVGSLWHVDDALGADVARRVYEDLRADGGGLDVGRTARVLHAAVRALRSEYPATPSLWACQVHAGP
ncbi:CHAT domain-containing protein [uncultured Streptomyces sp.]|uniref:CHAT domain-containing protein n=1 Tax=uncultured Streptomyces sp. TaxID=174707 RepID=UPI00260D9DF1|nr:CHAT domain-containing protein [uncultured Streptomyces sp.]